jgi:hypothetical protein
MDETLKQEKLLQRNYTFLYGILAMNTYSNELIYLETTNNDPTICNDAHKTEDKTLI